MGGLERWFRFGEHPQLLQKTQVWFLGLNRDVSVCYYHYRGLAPSSGLYLHCIHVMYASS